ncbi:MAG: 2-oxoacid:ferredoxin oxidoreductase subunit beta [Rhodothermales bacterium]|nr:2-oxoacid:ferredoxin oxidoreductase subunit beta [Rhodothermales bacterium]
MSENNNQPKGKPVSLPPRAAKPAGPPKMPPSTGKKPSGPPGVTLPPGKKTAKSGVTRKDFVSDQDIRWCPGCGDYAILATVQRLMPELNVPRENTVFISGIGCSSRFPYYMNTYGMHSIHGRAPAIATGLKASRPELDVWIVTGDGDSLSIGGNHLIHLLRRNVNVQLLLFNNQIYGLTKGQYSPTSEIGKVTKSTPYGSLDHPFNPASVALGADATFVARSMDRDPKHLKEVLKASHTHVGASFVEIYQNCNIFNDGAFFDFTEKESKPRRALLCEHGKPLTFDNDKKGLRLDGYRFEAIDLEGDWSIDDCLIYDETNRGLAGAITRIFFDEALPQPFGIFYREERPNYDRQLHDQIDYVLSKRGEGSLADLLHQGDTWVIEE